MTSPRSVRRPRASLALGALLLAVVLGADVAQSGRGYVYCVTMQAVMHHACCAPAADGGNAHPALVAGTPDCCQQRAIASLGQWTQAVRSAELSAPLVAIVPRPWVATTPLSAAMRDRYLAAARTGPPASRVRAQLMVFLI